MAEGRKDYTWGVLQDNFVLGRYQANWLKTGTGTIEAGDNDTLLEYTVPAGYKFFLTAVFLTCNSQHRNLLYIMKTVFPLLIKYFNMNYDSEFASLGAFPYNAGDIFKVNAYNYDSIDVFFMVQAYGVLEEIV